MYRIPLQYASSRLTSPDISPDISRTSHTHVTALTCLTHISHSSHTPRTTLTPLSHTNNTPLTPLTTPTHNSHITFTNLTTLSHTSDDSHTPHTHLVSISHNLHTSLIPLKPLAHPFYPSNIHTLHTPFTYPHTPSHTLTHPHTPSHTLTHPHTPSHTLTPLSPSLDLLEVDLLATYEYSLVLNNKDIRTKTKCASVSGQMQATVGCSRTGRYLLIWGRIQGYLKLCEVTVIGGKHSYSPCHGPSSPFHHAFVTPSSRPRNAFVTPS